MTNGFGDAPLSSTDPNSRICVPNAVIWVLMLLALGAPFTVVAQPPASATQDSLSSLIVGTVKDSLGFAVDGASVLVTPGGSIYRTDRAGKFYVRRIGSGPVAISVRKLGFSPQQTQVSLRVGDELALDIVMQRIPQMLAEVEVRADRECPRFTIEGVLCRRESGMGFFMNRQEILAKGEAYPDHPRLVLRDAPGFRRSLRGNPNTVESIVGWRCVKWIYDGGFPYSYNPVQKVAELYAVEVYQPPDIPLEYQHWYWDQRDRSKKYSTPCTLVVLWSMEEAQRYLRRLPAEKK